MYKAEGERQQDSVEKLEEHNDRIKDMKELRGEHTAISEDDHRQMEALLDLVKVMM